MYFVVEGHFINSAPAIPSVNDYTGTHYKVWVGKSKECVCLIVATVAVCLREGYGYCHRITGGNYSH